MPIVKAIWNEWITRPKFLTYFQELVEKLGKGELPKEDYPCLNDPSQTFHGTSNTAAVNPAPAAHSMRSKRTHTWARPRSSDDGYSRYYCHSFCTWV